MVVPEGLGPGDEFEVTIDAEGSPRSTPRSSPRAGEVGEFERDDTTIDDTGVGSSLSVVCPDGVGPGDTITVTTAAGEEVDVVVPDGVESGQEFEVTLGTPDVEEEQEDEQLGEELDDAGADDGSSLSVVCPDGVGPGDTITVTTAAGEEVDVVVPDGVESGQEFEVTLGTPEEQQEKTLEAEKDDADGNEDQLLADLEAFAFQLESGAVDPAVDETSGFSPEALSIVCPDGCAGGDAITVTTAIGDLMDVVVPDGIGAGDEFEVIVG